MNPAGSLLDENNIPVSVYDSLIDAIGKNMDAMYKYVSFVSML